MLFNSFPFVIFLPIVFFFYWFLAKNNYRLQNLLLLISSYFFYAFWDPRFLGILIFSTFLDFFSGIQIENTTQQNSRKFWLTLSIIINLSILWVCKYYDFFAQSFADFLDWFWWQVNPIILDIVLPLGISFYTFHGLSYIIDIYYRRISPERNFIHYALFVTYFPLLVAGPIERAAHLLPQITKPRSFSYEMAMDGAKQMLWWFFMKMVVADNIATYVTTIFNHSYMYSGGTLMLGAILFSFQIYGDFAWYSHIALGTSKLFWITLLRNFAFPYFSRDIAEFWRRWHISLSSWFRDYVYIPLGGSRGSLMLRIRNTFIIFLISGFWHGANWTFLAWWWLHALYMVPLIYSWVQRKNMDIVATGKIFPTIREGLSIVWTFLLVTFAWIFFRSKSISEAWIYIERMFSWKIIPLADACPLYIIVLITFFMSIEWAWREKEHPLDGILSKSKAIRLVFFMLIFMAIFLFGWRKQEFIYFQF